MCTRLGRGSSAEADKCVATGNDYCDCLGDPRTQFIQHSFRYNVDCREAGVETCRAQAALLGKMENEAE